MQTNAFEFGRFSVEFETFFGAVFNCSYTKANCFSVLQRIFLKKLHFGSVKIRRFGTPSLRVSQTNILFNFVAKALIGFIFGYHISFSITNNSSDLKVFALHFRADIYLSHIARHIRSCDKMCPLLKALGVFYNQSYFSVESRTGIPARRKRLIFEAYRNCINPLNFQICGNIKIEIAVTIRPYSYPLTVYKYLSIAHGTVESENGFFTFRKLRN